MVGQNVKKVAVHLAKMYNSCRCILARGGIYYTIENRKGRREIGKMMDNRIYGDLDDMIFADCDWQPSER